MSTAVGWFDVCWDRIARAKAHRKALVDGWNAYGESEPFNVRIDLDPEGPGDGPENRSISGRLVMGYAKPVPRELSLELGEFLYQMRAALDACIHEVACANDSKRPHPEEGALEFPICGTAESFQNNARKIRPLTKEQRWIIESMQPYNAPKELSDADLPLNFNRGLGILHDWARKDRHRRLHVVAAWASQARPMIRLAGVMPGVFLKDVVMPLGGAFPITNDTTVLTFRIVAPPGTKSKVQVNPNLLLDVGVDEVPPPCHPRDRLEARLQCIDLAVGTIVNTLGQTVGVNRVE